MEKQVRRLVTRSDFDGLACAMMLKELNLIDEIKFVHPKDVQDGKIELSKNDITTNLPYDPRVSIAFDHHESEVDRLKAIETDGKLIIDPNARSAARVVYDYYGGKEAFPNISDDLMDSIEPYDYSGLTAFSTAKLPGFLADKYDVSAEDCAGRADTRCENTVVSALSSTVTGYETCVPIAQDVRLHRGKVHYALLPVWLLNTKWDGKNFMFAMNGQTGKLVGDLPVSWKKFWLMFAAIAAPVAAVMAGIMYFLSV